MYQGETITTTISGFPVPISEIKDLKVLFKNNFTVLLEKGLNDCVVSDDSISFELSQEESLSLCTGKIDRSVVFITKDGSRIESKPSPIICNETRKDGVML